ncbi:MAG: lipoyl synthase [Nitrospinae bacterium]|nr:lipoyl synthase [Nitrospinota bacterium]MZH04596.1 lipoyl synthase [Nitrospinota bacterium]MZH15180.1 lipoyl synthase [Nitrospinota bacterium]
MTRILKKTQRLPEWLKTPLPKNKEFFKLKSLVQKYNLNTVCESASCPNIGKCWDAGTLTFMILGDSCSRACQFCDVATGNLNAPNPTEPQIIAETLSKLNLRYAVITSVDRDDLKDGGAGHWVETIKRIRIKCPEIKIETLIPDFQGNMDLVNQICEAEPDVLAHNLETVESLQSKVRPQCRYTWSLDTLRTAAKKDNLIVKSGLMLGMGEKEEEVIRSMKDLVDSGCQILSLGQYLRPSPRHLEVVEFVHPDRFLKYKKTGESLGLAHVEAGPLVRSSYLADQQARAVGLV